MMAHKPKSIQASRSQGQLVIEWEDGHRSQYPLAGLRAACPCAACRGGHEGMGVLPTPALLDAPLAPGASTDLLRLDAVGNYALQPAWQDGHDDGIYSWEYLRALCPCGVHAPVGGQE
jgi:DUF971 family protein